MSVCELRSAEDTKRDVEKDESAGEDEAGCECWERGVAANARHLR